jgi:uncharacterized membrane protein YgcG
VTVNLKRRVLALALIPVLGVPLAACDRPDTCDAITLSITGVDAGGKGGGKGSSGKSGKSKSGGKSGTSTSDDDCDD